MKYITQTLGLGIVTLSLVALMAGCGTETGETNDESRISGDLPGNRFPSADAESLPEDAIKRGAAEFYGAGLSANGEFVEFEELIADPEVYLERTIQTEGIIRNVCQSRGCWIELRSPEDSESKTITVKFLDYAFFMPLDSRGAIARIQGMAATQTLSAEEVAELVAEGYDPGTINEDGTATLVTFMASGVEMWNRDED